MHVLRPPIEFATQSGRSEQGVITVAGRHTGTMKGYSNTFDLDEVTFEMRPNLRYPTNPDWVCLRKRPRFVQRYRQMAAEFRGGNIVEVGVDQGGSTSFLLKLFRPKKLLAVELVAEPVQSLVDFLSRHDSDDCVELCLGVDQSDRVRLNRLVEEAFDGQPLDLVIDDASHLFEPSKATFETLFPRLRQGGIYVIEDWAADHSLERRFIDELLTNPDGDLARTLQENKGEPGEQAVPLSLLICQLLIASGRNPQWVAGVRAFNNFCEIRRGKANIEVGTSISEYTGELGQSLFLVPAN